MSVALDEWAEPTTLQPGTRVNANSRQTAFQKAGIAEKFSKAAHLYSKNALVQKDIADYMLNFGGFDAIKNDNATWLDIGCGAGYLLKEIAMRANNPSLICGLDIALGMLNEAEASTSHRLEPLNPACVFINADAEKLPLATNSVDNIVSSMALQWVISPTQALSEIARVLKSDGSATLAVLRGDSLPELHQGWGALDQGFRVKQFASTEQWVRAIKENGFKTVKHQNKAFLTYHPSVVDALHSVKDIGAGTTDNSKHPSITKSDLRTLQAWWLKNHSARQKLSLTYTVDFWHLQA